MHKPQFPEKIWDGLSNTRGDLNFARAPDYCDWLTIIIELQNTQKYLKALGTNVENIPNFEEILETMNSRIAELKQILEQYDPPEDLKKAVQDLRADLEASNVKESHELLDVKVRHLVLRAKLLEREQQEFQERLLKEVQIFQSQLRNHVTQIERQLDAKLDQFFEYIKELREALKGLE